MEFRFTPKGPSSPWGELYERGLFTGHLLSFRQRITSLIQSPSGAVSLRRRYYISAPRSRRSVAKALAHAYRACRCVMNVPFASGHRLRLRPGTVRGGLFARFVLFAGIELARHPYRVE